MVLMFQESLLPPCSGSKKSRLIRSCRGSDLLRNAGKYLPIDIAAYQRKLGKLIASIFLNFSAYLHITVVHSTADIGYVLQNFQ